MDLPKPKKKSDVNVHDMKAQLMGCVDMKAVDNIKNASPEKQQKLQDIFNRLEHFQKRK